MDLPTCRGRKVSKQPRQQASKPPRQHAGATKATSKQATKATSKHAKGATAGTVGNGLCLPIPHHLLVASSMQ